jgi:hypothetical protein
MLEKLTNKEAGYFKVNISMLIKGLFLCSLFFYKLHLCPSNVNKKPYKQNKQRCNGKIKETSTTNRAGVRDPLHILGTGEHTLCLEQLYGCLFQPLYTVHL